MVRETVMVRVTVRMVGELNCGKVHLPLSFRQLCERYKVVVFALVKKDVTSRRGCQEQHDPSTKAHMAVKEVEVSLRLSLSLATKYKSPSIGQPKHKLTSFVRPMVQRMANEVFGDGFTAS
jgi:hypothetical protein